MNPTNEKQNLIDATKKDSQGLTKRVVKGSLWVFALRIAQLIFGFARLTVLAYMLSVDDFGLLGIAILMMMTLETFSETGFKHALIQKKKNITPYLDAAWTILIIRGFILFTCLYFIAPYAAIFFGAPEATPVIQVIGLSILFLSFTNIGVVNFQKELEFNKQFVFQFSGTLVDFIVAISAAIILQNVWALVFGLLAGNITRCVVSYIIHPYRPKISMDFAKIKELWGFGKWILGATILTFLLVQGDDIFVGKILGVTALGFYTLAYRYSNMPATEITHVISQVTFPTYSKLQDNIPKLREAYLKVLQVTAFLSFLAAGLIFAFANDFTVLVLGDKWLPMVLTLQILVVWGLTRSIGACTGPLFRAVKKPEISTKMIAARFVIFIILVYPFTITWGFVGTAMSVAIAGLITRPITDYLVIKIIKCSAWEYVKAILVPMIALTIMLIILFLLKFYVFTSIELIYFIIMIIIGLLVYFGFIFAFDKKFNFGYRDILKNQLLTLLVKSK
jgi:O-antigen/teichoic acid export membrane protein